MKIFLIWNLCAKADLKNATDVETSEFAKKIDLAGLKSDINKLEKNQTG